MKTKYKRRAMNFFIVLNIALIIIGAVTVFLYQRNRDITFRAVSDFEEGKGEISDYYQKTIKLDYEKGLKKEIDFFVFNTEHKNMKVLFSVQGELNSSVELYENLVDFLPSEDSKKFSYWFNMPDEIENKPGLHKAEIIALEVPRVSSGEYAGSSSRVVSEIEVYVPYPGKYPEAEISGLDAEQNKSTEVVVSITNRGKSEIKEAKAKIDIYTILNEKIAELETGPVSISSGEKKELTVIWNADSFPGDYIAKYIVFYDGESRDFEKKFAIGAKNMSIEGLMVNNFQLGEIAKLQILVENKWNQELGDVLANLIVYDSENQVMADIKSATENIPALSKKELIAYWDTVKVDEGEYNAKLAIKYGDKSITRELVFRVSQDSLEVFGIGYVVRPKIMQGATMATILLILVIILLVVNLAWFAFFMRMRKKIK